MNVLLTGAHGTVGSAIRDRLDDRYEFTYLDVEEHPEFETAVADVSEYDELAPHLEGQDAVVHLAMPDWVGGSTSRELGWDPGLERDTRTLCNVIDGAREADVEKVIYASSNHAVGLYEVTRAPEIYYPGHGVTVDHTVPPRPDSRYGLVKVFGEGLGRLAAEVHGLDFAAIRICAVRDEPYDHPYGDAERGVERGDWDRGSEGYDEQVARLKGMWHSRRDLAQMVERCLETEDLGFDVFYGVSDNDRRWFDIDHARDRIGYDPQDNGEEWDAPPE